jgi:hypothetical protein
MVMGSFGYSAAGAAIEKRRRESIPIITAHTDTLVFIGEYLHTVWCYYY